MFPYLIEAKPETFRVKRLKGDKIRTFCVRGETETHARAVFYNSCSGWSIEKATLDEELFQRELKLHDDYRRWQQLGSIRAKAAFTITKNDYWAWYNERPVVAYF